MKRYILMTFAAAMMLAGCNPFNIAEEIPVPDGEMAVCLSVEGLQALPGTRSYVDGTEPAISDDNSILMLCFDGEGQFIASRKGTVTPSSATAGSLTGYVPANTSRIHFIANSTGLDISAYGMGSLERVMMKSAALSSGIEDNVRFWGFHAEANPGAMATWLKSSDKVWLLRDRAKVTVINNDPDIESVEWTITNGLNRGFVAAMSASGQFPYTNDYVNGTVMTEYRSSGVYNFTAADENNSAIWTPAGEANPQFLFENSNMSIPVKLIVKATYKSGSFTNEQVRYHTLLLQDNNKATYRVFRNNSFVLTIQNLPSDKETTSMGSSTFQGAVESENYSNNPYAQVQREVDEVSTDEFRLKVESVIKMFNSKDANGNGVVNFEYTALGSASTSGLTAANFEVSWEGKADDDETEDMAKVNLTPTVAYDASTGKGTVTFAMEDVTTDLKHNAFQILAKNSGLSRMVDLYSITSFSFADDPYLEELSGTTRRVGNVDREVYKLSFKLDGNFLQDLYPIKVRMYTATLVPYSDNTATSVHGAFNVVVGSTNSLGESSTTTDWNYGAKSWGSWYEYVIDTPSANNEYTIYLYDIRANLSVQRTLVGMYFEVEDYGPVRPLTAVHHEIRERTFQRANFSWSGNTGTSTQDKITVSLGNSDDWRDDKRLYLITYYSDYSLRIGRNTGNGTVTVTATDGFKISSIEITYFHRNRQTAAVIGTEVWPAKDFVGGNVTASPGSYSRNGMTGTWTGDPATSVTLTMSRDSENESPRIVSIKVTYEI